MSKQKRPDWCVKPKPCDFDVNSSYCPHRECRENLLVSMGDRTHLLDINVPTWRAELHELKERGKT